MLQGLATIQNNEAPRRRPIFLHCGTRESVAAEGSLFMAGATNRGGGGAPCSLWSYGTWKKICRNKLSCLGSHFYIPHPRWSQEPCWKGENSVIIEVLNQSKFLKERVVDIFTALSSLDRTYTEDEHGKLISITKCWDILKQHRRRSQLSVYVSQTRVRLIQLLLLLSAIIFYKAMETTKPELLHWMEEEKDCSVWYAGNRSSTNWMMWYIWLQQRH